MRVRLEISGRVQGVGYRYSAQREAQRLGLSGWVRNTLKGNVETVVEGQDAIVEQFVAWCHKGPPSARVTLIRRATENATGEFDGFAIRR